MTNSKKITQALIIAFGCAAAILSLSSCKMTKKLNQMQDAANDAGKNTDTLKKLTCTMYTSMRQDSAMKARAAQFEALKTDDNIEARLSDAAIYMQGFEYQVWTPDCVEVNVSRDGAFAQAAQEILTKMQAFVKDRGNASPTKSDDAHEILYSLAATLHRVNENQENLLGASGYSVIRPVDILYSGLDLDNKKNRGELVRADMPEYATVVGKYQKDALYLLRLRHNFLLAYAYAVSDADNDGDAPKFMKKIRRVLGSTTILGRLFGSKWKPNLKSRTTTEIEERITLSLVLAVETRKELEKLGFDPMVNETVWKLWSKADFTEYSETNLTAMDNGSPEEKIKANAIRSLLRARDAVVNYR